MDYLKELSNKLGGAIRSQNLSNWNLNGKSNRKLVIKNHRGFKIVIDEYDKIFDIDVVWKNLQSNFALSINLPNKLHGYNKPTTINNFPYKVYFSKDNDPNLLENKNFQTFWEPFSKKMTDMILTEIEGVFFITGAIYLAFSYERDVISIIDYIIDLIENNPIIFYKIPDERIFKKNIPENLRSLIPLLKKWSIPDDSEREQLLEETSEKQKKKLVKTVGPYMVEINQFLDLFGDEPLSHEAILLGNLAELVSELGM